jgi:type VI secretion system protein VasD
MRLLSIRPFFYLALLMLAACTSNAPALREPLRLTVSINAGSSVNPDDQKRPAPILVRVYELKNADTFNQADFYSLQDKDKTVLADDLVARDQFLLRPGESKTIARNANDASTTLGVIARKLSGLAQFRMARHLAAASDAHGRVVSPRTEAQTHR